MSWLCEQALGNDYTSKDEFARLTWPALEKKIQGCDMMSGHYVKRRHCHILICRTAVLLLAGHLTFHPLAMALL